MLQTSLLLHILQVLLPWFHELSTSQVVCWCNVVLATLLLRKCYSHSSDMDSMTSPVNIISRYLTQSPCGQRTVYMCIVVWSTTLIKELGTGGGTRGTQSTSLEKFYYHIILLLCHHVPTHQNILILAIDDSC